MTRPPMPYIGMTAANCLLVLQILGHAYKQLGAVAQVLLSVLACLVLAAEQQRHSTTRFETHSKRAPSPSRRSSAGHRTATQHHTSPVPTTQTSATVFRSGLDYAEHVARVRAQECPSLIDACYLDAAAAPPFPSGLVRRIHEDLSAQLYSNPHSKSPSAVRTAALIETVRTRVMQELFGITNTQDWHLIFTSGATASMKLVGEAYDWRQDTSFSCLRESHTSLLGIRDLAAKAGASFTTFTETELPSAQSKGLIGIPLQCNATGRRNTDLARSVCRSKGEAHVLLDAASYLSSSSHMDMSALPQSEQPDFVAFSFYKVFGYPTGLGGLLVKRSAESALCDKTYYGGGTVDAILPHSQWTRPRRDFVSRFEDGTVHFQGVLAIRQALDYYKTTFGPLAQRRLYVQSLTQKLYETIAQIRHANGARAVKVYSTSKDSQRWLNATSALDDDQGPILNFNIQAADGSIVPPQEVDRLASVSNIHLRMGRHCNAGFVVEQLGATEEQLQLEYANGVGCDESGDSDTISTSLRVSLCLLNTDEDLRQLETFIRRFFVHTADLPAAHNMRGTEQFKLETVSVYPIKSCAGQDLLRNQKWKLTPHGLQHDREWIVMDLRTGKMLSQKRYPQMTLIRPFVDVAQRTMVVTVASGLCQSFTIDLDDDTQYEQDSGLTARVRSDTTRPRAHKSAVLQRMLTEHLGVPCTLAKQDSNSSRHSKLAASSQDKIPLLFSNESPFLLINSASLDKVSELMAPAGDDALDVDERASDSGYSSQSEAETAHAASFRANFVISPTSTTAAAWTEDTASRFQLGSHTFAVLGQCRRCQMVCIDQKTGQLRPETFQTLAKHRRNSRGRIIFGSHLTWMPLLDNRQTAAQDEYVWAGMEVQVSH